MCNIFANCDVHTRRLQLLFILFYVASVSDKQMFSPSLWTRMTGPHLGLWHMCMRWVVGIGNVVSDD